MSNKEKLWFKILSAAIMVLVIIHLLNLNPFILTPLIGFANAIFVTIIVTGVFYYLLRPLVLWLESKQIPSTLAVLLIYLTIGSLLVGIVVIIGPIVREQFLNLIENMPEMISSVSNEINSVWNQQNSTPRTIWDMLPNVHQAFRSEMSGFATYITDSLFGAFTLITGAIFSISLVPFILYYALKDGRHLTPHVVRLAPQRYRKHLPELLKDLDETIAAFILGQATISFIVGVLLFIGYSIIGLEYALVLALLGMLVNVVPYLGPIIAAIPALLAALVQEPILALYVLIVTIVTQQIEGNLISPQVMGRTMDIHPITIVTLLVLAGRLTGILGIIFAVPAYAIAKVLIEHGIKIYRMQENPKS